MRNLDRLIKNLPTHQGILGRDEYFNSAVLIPLLLIEDEYHLLFEKRNLNIRQGGEICFPGGKIDNTDKNSEETALRETFEEVGIPPKNINILGKLDLLFGPRGIVVEPIVAEVRGIELNNLKLQKSEVEKIFSVPISFFVENPPEHFKIHSYVTHKTFNSKGEEEELISEKNSNETYYQTIRDVLVYKTNGEVIWGITARLVSEIVDKFLK